MNTINLKWLLSKKKIIPIIKDIVSLTDEAIIIEDTDKNILFEYGNSKRSA